MVLSIFVDEQCRRIFVNIDPYYERIDKEFFLKDTDKIRMFESLQDFVQSVNNNIIFEISNDVPKIIFKQNIHNLNQLYLENGYTNADKEKESFLLKDNKNKINENVLDYTYNDSEVLFE